MEGLNAHQSSLPMLLHKDILLLIFDQLTVDDLVSCSAVNKAWNLISKDERLWKNTDRGT